MTAPWLKRPKKQQKKQRRRMNKPARKTPVKQASNMPTIGRMNEANIQAVLGASGSGKTSYVMEQLREHKPTRVLVWDTKGEFAEEGHAKAVHSLEEMVKLARANESFRLALVPYGNSKQMAKLFDLFCMAAFHLGRLTLVAEELAEVTSPTFAVAGWKKCTTQGRTQGLTIYGLSQTPADIDKKFFGNATLIRCGRLNEPIHAKKMAGILGVPAQEILDMPDFHFIEKNTRLREITRGKLAFR
ncbi:hypothetical protein [Janthinobacterium sp. B9-8]|uniref:hypothetical protein n=1 Tax=Janthinobacterium sp. B9-8 TaxID=1236179 RepID=UPI0018D254C4|nr:hypothetical protein [Janthinobacterium sp. B9-8]